MNEKIEKTPEQKSLDAALGALNKSFGKSFISQLGDEKIVDMERISTGSFGLDKILGGGLVRGVIAELYGQESAGKSTLATHMMAEHQKFGEVAMIDEEHVFDPNYASKLGLDVSKLIFSQPTYAEEALETIEVLAATGAVSLIVLDSVAGLSPRAEMDGETGASNMGLIARLMGQHLRKVKKIALVNKCSILYINQIRMKIGVVFGSPLTTPGGNALKYFSSVRMDIKKTKSFDTGIISMVKTPKNKTFAPFKSCQFQINFGEGIDCMREILNAATEKKIVDKAGSWFSYGDLKIGQGEEKAMKFLKNEKQIFEEIKGKLLC